MIANAEVREKLLKHNLNFMPVACLSKGSLSACAVRSQLQLPVIKQAEPSIEFPNAHPDPAVWVPILGLLALSIAAGYLFWAKISGAWPFP